MNSLDRFVDGIFEELSSPPDTDPPLGGEKPGDIIGHYTLVEQLGIGGFGVVWRAEQSKPVRREVALKIIKLGMDTREVIARFEAERQALAVLDHPGIAKVFDAGATPTGRPYFVMELVRGLPLVRHCDDHALPLVDRLSLFTDVCRAVQHAHQKGIIHRDIKPSNLLVTLTDGEPVPKVIDFGIAKATGESRLTDNTLVTRMDRLMGTPAYMSPEQAEAGKDIDTRTDIYSLGAVLYELLTGQVPFPTGPDGTTPSRAQDAQRPSTRIRSFTQEQLQKLGETHRAEGPKLVGLIKGDLDWIVMKALERDRNRRYDSADALGEDVRSFLEQKPVAARPPTTWYLVRRFTQRNKLAVGASALILLTLIAGITISTRMYFDARRALARSQQVSQFMKDILAQARVSAALGRDTTMMREILDKTAERIGTELRDQPEVEAELRTVIGRTYENIDEYDLAIQQTAEAVRLLRTLRKGDDDGLAEALSAHASALEYAGRIEEAEPVAREALAMRQRLSGRNDVRSAWIEGLLAWILHKAERHTEGEPFARHAVEVWRKHPEDPELTVAPRALAGILFKTRRHEESLTIYQEELALLKEQLGAEHPKVTDSLENLGRQLIRMGRNDEAETVLKEVLRQSEKFYKDRSPLADHALRGLSRIAGARKQWDLQLHYVRESMAASQRVFPDGHRYHREASNELAKVLIAHAERHAEEAWKVLETDPAQSKQSAETALRFINELRAGKPFAPDVKSASGWLDCLEGRTLSITTSDQAQARQLIEQGLATLRKKSKPSEEDTKRRKKAEAWQTTLSLPALRPAG